MLLPLTLLCNSIITGGFSCFPLLKTSAEDARIDHIGYKQQDMMSFSRACVFDKQ